MTGVWDQVLAFGSYQHTTVDGEPVRTVFDASSAGCMLTDFEKHPESDIFYDKQHQVVDELGEDALDRDKLEAWGDGHALAWADALAMVVAGQVVRYVPHQTAPAEAPSADDLRRTDGTLPDGVYARRSDVTPRGADPKDGLAAFRHTSPYFVEQPDGYRLLNLTVTNDPRMRGAALAYQRGKRVAMTRVAKENAPATEPARERPMNELMARAGCMESDTPEQKLEKLSAYAAKMEEAAKAPAAEAMAADPSAIRRAEEELQDAQEAYNQYAHKPDSDEAKRDRKNQLDYAQKNLARLKSMSRGRGAMDDRAPGEAAAAMTRAAERAADQATRKLLQGLGLPSDPELAKAKLDGLFALQGEMAEERKRIAAEREKSKDTEAKRWAKSAISMGRWKADQRGTVDDTVAFLEAAYKRDPGEAEKALYEEGTFQVSERVVMERLTEGGAGKGAPSPRASSDDPDALMDREIARIQKEDPKADFTVAMARVKKDNPKLHQRYQAFIAEGGLARRN